MLEKTGISMGQVDQVEINEAFAAQTLACQKGIGDTFPPPHKKDTKSLKITLVVPWIFENGMTEAAENFNFSYEEFVLLIVYNFFSLADPYSFSYTFGSSLKSENGSWSM